MPTFKQGQTVYSEGFNMQCKPVICELTFVRYEKTEHFDCVVLDPKANIRIFSDSKSLYLTMEEVSL